MLHLGFSARGLGGFLIHPGLLATRSSRRLCPFDAPSVGDRRGRLQAWLRWVFGQVSGYTPLGVAGQLQVRLQDSVAGFFFLGTGWTHETDVVGLDQLALSTLALSTLCQIWQVCLQQLSRSGGGYPIEPVRGDFCCAVVASAVVATGAGRLLPPAGVHLARPDQYVRCVSPPISPIVATLRARTSRSRRAAGSRVLTLGTIASPCRRSSASLR